MKLIFSALIHIGLAFPVIDVPAPSRDVSYAPTVYIDSFTNSSQVTTQQKHIFSTQKCHKHPVKGFPTHLYSTLDVPTSSHYFICPGCPASVPLLSAILAHPSHKVFLQMLVRLEIVPSVLYQSGATTIYSD